MSKHARARLLRAAVLIASAAAPIGCSVVTALTDLDSEYGADRASDREGGAGADARPDDASAPDDVRADGAGASLCEGDAHDLCDDFDTLPLGDPSMWTSTFVDTSGAAMELATDLSFSSPRALSVTTPTSGENARALLERDFPGAATAIDCSFQLRAETLDHAGLVLPVALVFTPPPATGWAESSVEIRMGDDGLYVRVNAYRSGGESAFYIQRDLGPPLKGQWLLTRLRVSGLDASPRLQIWLGGNVAVDEAVTLPPIAMTGVQLGAIGSLAGAKPWRTLFDDVVCDVTRP